MAANSKHPLDIYMWILKVTNSCTKVKHISASLQLLQRYKKQYPKESKNLINALKKNHYKMVDRLLPY